MQSFKTPLIRNSAARPNNPSNKRESLDKQTQALMHNRSPSMKQDTAPVSLLGKTWPGGWILIDTQMPTMSGIRSENLQLMQFFLNLSGKRRMNTGRRSMFRK